MVTLAYIFLGITIVLNVIFFFAALKLHRENKNRRAERTPA